MKKQPTNWRLFHFRPGAGCCLFLQALLILPSSAVGDLAGTEAPDVAAVAVTGIVDNAWISRDAGTNTQRLLDAILRLETGIASNRAAINQSAMEYRFASASNAAAFARSAESLKDTFEARHQALADQSARELDLIRSGNQLMLKGAAAFAGVACLIMITITYFQWRTGRVWSELSASLARRSLGVPSGFLAGPGDPHAGPDQVAHVNQRLLGALEHLERRLEQLEQSVRPVLRPEAAGAGGNGGRKAAEAGGSPEVAEMLREGQARLRQNDLEAALACFDQALTVRPDSGDALVRKGVVLERMQRTNEAFGCYDRAIALAESPALAYLHKGSLCNRLERYKEALDCYEKALQSQSEGR